MEIIPAIDIIDGKCVRLVKGDYARKKVYSENPVEVAKKMERAGIKRLHLVDLDGARKGTLVNLKILENIASSTGLIIDFGGGIKTSHDLKTVFQSGAAMAAVGSVAVKNPSALEEWIKSYGPEKIMLGADVKNEKIVVSGWAERTGLPVFDFIKTWTSKGIKNIFCTDISRDGMLKGPSVNLYLKILKKNPGINLIASGGVSSVKDVEKLSHIGCRGVIIGKAIYEGRITMAGLKKLSVANK